MVAVAILSSILTANVVSGAPDLPLAGRALLAINGLVGVIKTIKVRPVVLILATVLNLQF